MPGLPEHRRRIRTVIHSLLPRGQDGVGWWWQPKRGKMPTRFPPPSGINWHQSGLHCCGQVWGQERSDMKTGVLPEGRGQAEQPEWDPAPASDGV